LTTEPVLIDNGDGTRDRLLWGGSRPSEFNPNGGIQIQAESSKSELTGCGGSSSPSASAQFHVKDNPAMQSLRAKILTPNMACVLILSLAIVFALEGVGEWFAPATRPVTGKAGPLYFFSEALFGPRGPAYAYWGIAAFLLAFGLAVLAKLLRQHAKERNFEQMISKVTSPTRGLGSAP
jgi:hypothetical protein